MSRRPEFWQHLLQLRKGFIHGIRVILGTWPGLLTIALLFTTLTLGLLFFSNPSGDVSAKAPTSLAQISTRVPTRRAIFAATATRRLGSPTPAPTLTATPTATQAGASPLLTERAAISQTVITQVVPLPTEHTGPYLDPTGAITESQSISTTLMPTVSVSALIAEASPLTGTPTDLPALIPTATPDVLLLLMPTPTPTLAPTLAPTATPSIIEALEKPVPSGGMASIVASATAIVPTPDAPTSEVPSAETPAEAQAPEAEAEVPDEASNEAGATEEPTVTDAEPLAPDVAAAVATAASEPTPDGNVRSVYVPILMYHYLSVPPANADRVRLDLSVTPDLFAAHLDAMQQAGYTTISLYTLLDHLTKGSPLPEKPVVITFDDGYRDNYVNAFPLLRDRGLTATFFIVPDFINDQLPEYLTWDMVREMYAAGMSIEGHGRNHVSLANKDRDYLIWQALGTYESIQHEIGVRPHFISYPAGDYDQQTIDVFRSADYWAGLTTEQGATHRNDDLFQMERIRVRGTASPEELLRLLELDW